MTWEDYHGPPRIIPEVEKLGRELNERFKINYEKVYEEDYRHLEEDVF